MGTNVLNSIEELITFANMRKKYHDFVRQAIISAVLFSLLLLPFQLLYVNGLTELRPIIFIPIVLGIFWGAPAAVGIFLGHLVCNAICGQTGVLFLASSMMSALAAIGVRYLFYLPVSHDMVKGQYVHDFWSLLKFIISVLVTETVLSGAYSAMMCVFTEADFISVFRNVLFNNIHSVFIIGIPVMLFLPLLQKWANEPACTVEMDKALYGYSSVNAITFRKVMTLSILFVAMVCSMLFFGYRSGHSKVAASIDDVLLCFALIDVLFLLFTSFIIYYVQKELAEPLRALASKMKVEGETYSNEFDIISKSMDFVVSGSADLVSGNEHSILIGLTTKDFSKHFSIAEAREIINGICLNHVKGYISSVSGEGGYCGEASSGAEQVLIYTVYGATDSQIHLIAGDILDRLCQESVLIEKNRNLRYYYFGEKRKGLILHPDSQGSEANIIKKEDDL